MIFHGSDLLPIWIIGGRKNIELALFRYSIIYIGRNWLVIELKLRNN